MLVIGELFNKINREVKKEKLLIPLETDIKGEIVTKVSGIEQQMVQKRWYQSKWHK